MKFTPFIAGLLFSAIGFCQSKFHSDSIPFSLTEFNNMSVKSIINQTDSLQLMFHLANGGVSITKKAAEQLSSIEWDLIDSVGSWGGMSVSTFSQNNHLQVGTFQWDSLLLSSCMHSGKKTDGKFGPDLFGDKVLEINFDRSLLILHDQLPDKLEKYEKVNLTYENGMFFITGTTELNGDPITNRFLLHSGYSSAILFDDQFVAQHQLGKKLILLSESELLDSFGNRLKTKKSQLHQFNIGNITFENIPVSFFEGAIGKQKISVLGMDILKRFNLIFDSTNQTLYLQKNHHFHSPYFEG